MRASASSLPECLCDQGFDGANCSELVCPGNPPCNNRGSCVLDDGSKTPRCSCQHNFVGQACEECAKRYSGANCETCIDGFIGWPIGCNVTCFHGNASGVRQNDCVCHNDSSLGFWEGDDCGVCQEGWKQPDCTACDETHVGDNCDILCYTRHARYGDPRDGGLGKLPIVPTPDCVENNSSQGTVRVWFGYDNRNPHNVYLDAGPLNYFSPPSPLIQPGGYLGFLLDASGKYPAVNNENRGQPSKFIPGNHRRVFSIT